MSDVRRACLHGHAYQPPRADPMTGRVPVEPSAAPFHDWNHRITAECYAPCTATRLHDAAGRVTAIVNLFERMSFDLGPTLARWLAREAPAVHDAIVAADRVGRTAIAHPYHHVILPLAREEDALTELRWGMADFRARFGREPDGMWLPETAIDARTLAQLDALGLQCTVLAPHQVEQAPETGAVGRVTGSGVTLVVYDGPASHDVAFGAALTSAAALADRLTARPGLVVAAADVETFGHHHPFTERAVGHALFEELGGRGWSVGGLAASIDGIERVDVRGVRTSAWSCAHGVERWRSDCGCATDARPGSHQRWRAPLRAALETLRDHAFATFVEQGRDVFHDPLAARDAYGEVLAGTVGEDAWIERHVRPLASDEQALLLLAGQEATLASFTSCAWFFADLARREVAIVLQEAARSVSILQRLGADAPLEQALAQLDAAEGLAGDPSGRAVWDWAMAQADVTDRDGTLLRWDTASPIAELVADLAREAVAGSDEAARRAAAVVAGSSGSEPFTVAQERVYRALRGAGGAVSADLVALGAALGLATAAVSG